MQDIRAWLDGDRNYDAGMQLYQVYGANAFLKNKVFPQGPTKYNIEKLEAELEDLAPAQPAPLDAFKSDIEMMPPPEPEPAQAMQEHKSREYQLYLQIQEERKIMYRQLERCMIELDLGTDQGFLHITAKQIVSLDEKIRQSYKLTDIYDETGTFPKTKATVLKTSAEEIQLLRVTVWKAKQRLKSPSCRDRKQTEQLIAKSKARIIELGGTVK